MTNVPEPTFAPTGLVLPTESAILTGVQEDLNAAFGGNLNPGLNTPQGQLASSIAAMVANANTVFATFVNQVDPDTATGFMQDAIGRIYFLNRLPATPTTVSCLCTGVLGTVIPVGAQVVDTSGNIYSCTTAGTIPSGGSITLPFANIVTGPIACPANTVTQIYVSIPGWESVNNSAAGTAGTNVETPAAFEYRRQQSVGLNSQGSLPAIYAAVAAVPLVVDVFVTQNNTDSVVSSSIAGNPNSTSFPVAARSIYVAASGGTPQAIAQAIWQAANIGPGYQTAAGSAGATLETLTVQDTSGYSTTIPAYTVTYISPAVKPVYFAVTIATNSNLPSNIVSLIQSAIINAFNGNGTTSTRSAHIGGLILASSFYAPVAAVSKYVQIKSLYIGFASAPTGTSVQMGIDQVPGTDNSFIAVTIS